LFGSADVGPGSFYCNIKNSAKDSCSGKKSSYQLADEIEADALAALKTVNAMSAKPNTELWVAVNNIKALSFLSLYYAYKIRGATYKLAGEASNTTTALAKAYCWWINYTNLMDEMYEGQANQRSNPVLPDWHFQDATVLKEYNHNGGVGTPDFKQLKIEQY
jgi:hypothetical protein